jgi:hypothetical protein
MVIKTEGVGGGGGRLQLLLDIGGNVGDLEVSTAPSTLADHALPQY